jgi:tripartite-type tricarboxylate transporter receptor subunit TctC
VAVIVENKPGAGAAIGADYVAKSTPDGYTVLSGPSSALTISPILNPIYKVEDLTPICLIAGHPLVLAVRSDSPFKTLDDMISFAKKNPGKLNYGCVGHSSASYFAMEVLKVKAGVDIVFVPFTAGADVTALLGGVVDMTTNSFTVVSGMLRAGKIRALAVEPRTPLLPNIPSFADKGFSDIIGIWTGYFVPKGTPEPVIQRLAHAFESASRSPSLLSQQEKLGFTVDFMDGKKLTARILSEYKLVEEIVRKTGMVK